jgi:hypothetical protein
MPDTMCDRALSGKRTVITFLSLRATGIQKAQGISGADLALPVRMLLSSIDLALPCLAYLCNFACSVHMRAGEYANSSHCVVYTRVYLY